MLVKSLMAIRFRRAVITLLKGGSAVACVKAK